MRKIILSTLLTGFTGLAVAAPAPVVPVSDYPKQNKISYQLSVEKWVNTDTARVTVSVNASLDQKALESVQQAMQTNLKQLANVNWRIVNFSRDQSQSGLETVTAIAQARVPANQIKDMRGKAKSLSKPGMQYQINDISYQPTDDEIQKANAALRQEVYQKVQSEINLLDKTFSDEDFYVQQIDFNSDAMPMPRAVGANVMMLKQAAAPSDTNVSQKVVLNVLVTVASTVEDDQD